MYLLFLINHSLNTSQEMPFYCFNLDGSTWGINTGVVYYKCNDISVIDVKNRHLRYVINMASELQFLTDSLFSVEISPDDSYLLLTERKTPKGYKPKSKLDYIPVIYDVESSKNIRLNVLYRLFPKF